MKWDHYLLSGGVKFLLCVIDVFTKCAWVKPLKDKKTKAVLHGFIAKVNKSKGKPNKLWVNQGREFYNNRMQIWLDGNYIFTFSTGNEGKPVVAERFIRTLKGKISKILTANDSKSYFGYFNKLVNEYNNTYHRSIGKKVYSCLLFCFDWRNWIESQSY